TCALPIYARARRRGGAVTERARAGRSRPVHRGRDRALVLGQPGRRGGRRGRRGHGGAAGRGEDRGGGERRGGVRDGGRSGAPAGIHRADAARRGRARRRERAAGRGGVDATGRVYGRRPGQAVIRATAGGASAETRVRVVENPAASYELRATATTARTGDVIRMHVRGRARDGREVTGFRPEWSVSGVGAQVEAEGEAGVFVAERPGRYTVTALVGEGRAETVVLDIADRGPGGRLLKVGRGPASTHNSADTWVFTGVDGRDYAIIGTFMHDWAK